MAWEAHSVHIQRRTPPGLAGESIRQLWSSSLQDALFGHHALLKLSLSGGPPILPGKDMLLLCLQAFRGSPVPSGQAQDSEPACKALLIGAHSAHYPHLSHPAPALQPHPPTCSSADLASPTVPPCHRTGCPFIWKALLSAAFLQDLVSASPPLGYLPSPTRYSHLPASSVMKAIPLSAAHPSRDPSLSLDSSSLWPWASP